MSNEDKFESISFDLPKNKSNVIKVIGVGGGGSNAINHMFQQGIKGVDFVICNTDAQALQNSGVPNKIQLGVHLTEGLGAGANPEVGEQSAVESLEEIQAMLQTNTKMVFITAGMGGGTGTGAAPIIAKMAMELNILTVGIVTMPFQFEGRMRNEQAQNGINKLRKNVDSLIVINNNKLREVYGDLGFKAGFSKADEVLATAARGIAEVITHHYTQNIDLRDAKTVLTKSGTAIMGSATASGDDRANLAITKALDSPLLNDNKIHGAKNVLLLIVSGTKEITIDEIGLINDHIQSEAGKGTNANIIMGVGDDENLGEDISVTIIATGFNQDQQNQLTNIEVKKVVHTLEEEQAIEKPLNINKLAKPIKEASDETINKAIKNDSEPIIKHALKLDDAQQDPMPNLIQTTEKIKAISVVYEHVNPLDTAENDDFVISDKTELNQTFVEEDDTDKEQQFTLTFDLPINKTKPTENNEVNDIKVNDYTELVPVFQVSNEHKKRYVLEDDTNEESHVSNTKNSTSKRSVEPEDEEIVFEKKIIEVKEDTDISDQELDPIHSPISQMLKERANERRQKMKDFNYKFNTSKIEEIEKTPAYKRKGVDLEEPAIQNNRSRTSLSEDDNNEIQLRSNNSFLHDNVD